MMTHLRARRVASWLMLAGMGVVTASFVCLPRQVQSDMASTVVGGCTAGPCNGGPLTNCGTLGDGCGAYAVCTVQDASHPNPNNGNCVLKDYCSSTGCSVIHGGYCMGQ